MAGRGLTENSRKLFDELKLFLLKENGDFDEFRVQPMDQEETAQTNDAPLTSKDNEHNPAATRRKKRSSFVGELSGISIDFLTSRII